MTITPDTHPLRSRVVAAIVETPFEVLIFAVFVITAVYGLTANAGRAPGSLQSLLPKWLVVSWQICLLLGGSIGLIGRMGARWPIERAGLAIVAPAAFVYATAIVFRFGISGIVAALTYAMIGAAFAIRYWVLGRAVRAVIAIHDQLRRPDDASS